MAADINAMAAGIEKAVEETHRAMAVLEVLMGNVNAGVYVCDPKTNRLVYANEHLRKLVNRDELVGKICHEALQTRSRACPDCPKSRLFRDGVEPDFIPLRREKYNPLAKRDFLTTGGLVHWPDGRILYMEVSTDITDRKALVAAEAANQAQRSFLARMSHELRTPMNGVLGMTRLAMQTNPSAPQLEYLKKIQSSASLLLGIINDILDFSKIEAGKLEIENNAFNFAEMVENIRELLLPRIEEKNLRLIIEVDGSVPKYARGDVLRLSQVLLNLLGNATKFTPQGEVALNMLAKPLPTGKVRLNCTVRDSGIGMTPDQLQLLFKPFSQADSSTSRKFGGTGLGLSISKALVELMGGSISVVSEEGKGSSFSFFIELEPLETLAEEKDAEPSEEANARYDNCRILLVEDNEINQEIALALLSEFGAAVDLAENGEAGVATFMRADYDLIFMDIRMPIMDGLEAARRIRASSKHDAVSVPIIAMTANAMREDIEESRAAGMNGHIAKPIDVRELTHALFIALGDKRTRG
jgi:signal transduction histidine kinase/ActR/RegA family two-component response regulator